MRRAISFFIALAMAGFGSFWNGWLQKFHKPEPTTAVRTTKAPTTLPSYHAPEGVHTAPPGKGKRVALTFDDGPGGNITNHILTTLKAYRARATFFCVGDRAKTYAKTLRRMVAQNCEIGSHSWSHARLTRLSASELRNDLEKTANALELYSGKRPTLMRAPYGSVSQHMLRNTDFPVILWSIDSEDWRYCELLCKDRSSEKRERDYRRVVNSVLDYVQDGDIILMHDLYEFTQDAADTLIAALAHQGWQLVTVSELMQARGIELQNGKVYHAARSES